MPEQGRVVPKLDVDERKALTETMQDQEDVLNNVDGLGSDYIQDKDALRRNINRTKRRLAYDDSLVPKTTGDKKKVEDEIKQLKDLVLRDMPTKQEMNAKLGSLEAERATRKNIFFHQKHNVRLIRLKHLLRCVDPTDPFAGDLERIRPD